MTFSLGPFDLICPVGKGGMGTVWRGVHRKRGIRVAVKTIRLAQGKREVFERTFRREVRAMAALHHPHVVRVFDHGVVDHAAASVAGGRLQAGTAYLVMEYASGGTLSDWLAEPRPWHLVRDALLALLDALAHTHARGLVHRDLKPANVLLCTNEDLAPGLRLTDFGLAHLTRKALEGALSNGTPRYMAPEQFSERFRSLGPWTDLYALGGLAWHLITGGPVYDEKGSGALARAHLEGRRGAFRPRIPVPDGLESWLCGLLERDPFARVGSAAAAAGGLLALRAPVRAARGPSRPFAMADDPSTIVEITTMRPFLSLDLSGRRPAEKLPFVEDWRRPEGRPVPYLDEVGLGLFGLRTVPMVGRDDQRDAVWCALGEVVRQRRPVLMQLEGQKGSGRRRLASWIGNRANELGIAQVWRVRNQPAGGSAQGLGPALATHYGVAGLSHGPMEAVLQRELDDEGVHDPWVVRALASFVLPHGEFRFEGPGERRSVVHRALERATTRRPMILIVHEPHHDPDTLAAVSHVFEAGLPVLVLVTSSQQNWWPVAPRTVRIPPLDRADTRAMLAALLPVEPALVEQVCSRSEGVPLFAVQLLGDWVQRGELVPGPAGWELARDAQQTLPVTLHDLWMRRVEELARSDQERAVLELAAVLGPAVSATEWCRAAQEEGLEVPRDLLERLAERRLAQVGVEGWRFAHGLLAESLVAAARESGRLVRHHRAAAETLEPALAKPESFDRIASHLAAAGEPYRALHARLDAAYATLLSDRQSAAVLLRRVGQQADVLGLHPGDRLRLRVLGYQAMQADSRGAAVELREHILALAREHGSANFRVFALAWLLRHYLDAGHLLVALRLVPIVRRAADESDLAPARIAALREIAVVHFKAGDLLQAQTLLELALDACETVRSDPRLGHVRLSLLHLYAKVLRPIGLLEQAAAVLRRARLVCEQTGQRRALASVELQSAEVERERGDIEACLGALVRARALGPKNLYGPATLDLALCLVLAGRAGRALALAETVFEARIREAPQHALHARWAMVVIAAGLADWDLWEVHAVPALNELAAWKLADTGLAELVECAGRLAAEAGQHHRASRVWSAAARLLSQGGKASTKARLLEGLADEARRSAKGAPARTLVVGHEPSDPSRFVGMLDGEQVARLAWSRPLSPDTPMARLVSVWVMEPYRGQGLGTQLLRRALAIAYARGAKRVVAQCAAGFLSKRGFLSGNQESGLMLPLLEPEAPRAVEAVAVAFRPVVGNGAQLRHPRRSRAP
jgi:eukaryotic-like serine/threonine-protein kinase